MLGDLVLTHDSIAEGVHFFPFDPPASVGWKLVAVNLSDLAAKGAAPAGALLSLPLIGGDTIALPDGAPRVLGLTGIGRGGEHVPSRVGGQPGDLLWVVGTLGDSAAGLALLQNDPKAVGPLVDIYRRPVPLLAVGQVLAANAKAMMDISDGLLLDLSRLCDASGCGAKVDLDALPLSRAFVAERGRDRAARLFAATGGDDYALLAALSPEFDPLSLSLPSGTKVTRIGQLTEVMGLSIADASGPVATPEHLGHEHRGH